MARPENKIDAFGEELLAPVLVELSPDLLEQILRLENISYPNPWSEQLLENELFNSYSLSLGLLAGEKLVAQSFNHLIDDELHILNLAVDPDFRRQGFAGFLLSAVLLRARERGAERALLEVRVSNEIAKKLYLDFGFKPLGIRPRYYTNNAEDALVLARDLSED